MALVLLSQVAVPSATQPTGAIEDSLAKYVVFLTEKIPVSPDVTSAPIVFTPSGIVYVNVGLYRQDPNQMVNALVLETFSIFLINADALGLSGEAEKLAMARDFGTAIADYLNKGSLWFGSEGNVIDIDASYGVLRALLWAVRAGLVSADDPNIASSISALMSAQKQDGGWPINPVNPSAPSYTLSNPLVTAHVLDVLVQAYSLGMGERVRGLTSSIERAVDYLEGGAIRSGGEVYWNEITYRGFTRDRLQVTAEVSDALAKAALQGFEVDHSILAGAAKYLMSYMSMYQPDWDIAVPILHTLLRMSSLGVIDTKEVKVHAGLYVDLILEKQDEDSGLWSPPGSYGDILTALVFSSEIARFLLDWSKVSTIDLKVSASGLGYFTEYDPPRLVEGGELRISLGVENSAPRPRTFAVEVKLPPDLELVSNTSNPFAVGAYGNGSFSIKIKAAGAVEGVTNTRVTFLLKDHSGYVLYTRHFTFALARDGRLEILSKTVNPGNVSLGGVVTVSVSMRNRGDIPIQGCVIREILGTGFELLSQGANYSEVAQAAMSGYPYLGYIEPDQTVSYTYVVRAAEAPPGTILLSRTTVEYSDALGNPRNVTRESYVTVRRPLVYMELNSSQLDLQWGEVRALSVTLANDGNAESKEVVLVVTGNPKVSISVLGADALNATVTAPSARERRVKLGPLGPGESATLTVAARAGSFFLSPKQSDVISLTMRYSDPGGQVFRGFSDSAVVEVTVRMSTKFKILFISIAAVVGLLLAVRIVSWSRSRERRRRRYPPRRRPVRRTSRSPRRSRRI